jgi:hypothetical protein
MTWYAAHAIMYFRFRDGKQDYFPVWENVYLIEAPAGIDPLTAAVDRAKRDEDHDSTLQCDDRPAEMVFAGIRKIITVAHEREDDTLSAGDELTYAKFLVQSEEEFRRLVSGESVPVEYQE